MTGGRSLWQQWDPRRVKLFGDVRREQVQLWPGTCAAQLKSYAPEARIPAGSPRPVTPSEFQALQGAHFDLPRSIAVVSVRHGCVEQLREIAEAESQGRSVAQVELRDPLDDLVSCLLRELDFASAPHLTGFRTTALNTPTVTWDCERDNHPGLHVDSWDRAPLAARAVSTNRVCVNLGSGPRRFLFCDRGLDLMHAALAAVGIEAACPDSIADRFLERFPDYPLLGITLQPGDAYVAPTEYILHDGQAEGVTNSTLTIRSHIRYRRSAAHVA